MADTLTCKLVTPETTLFDGEATYVALPAHDGSMGVAPGRAPIVAELGYGELRVEQAGGGERKFFVGGGFVQVKGGKVTLLADEAMAVADVDAAEAKRVLAEEATALATGEVAIEARDRKAKRARAMLTVAG